MTKSASIKPDIVSVTAALSEAVKQNPDPDMNAKEILPGIIATNAKDIGRVVEVTDTSNPYAGLSETIQAEGVTVNWRTGTKGSTQVTIPEGTEADLRTHVEGLGLMPQPSEN